MIYAARAAILSKSQGRSEDELRDVIPPRDYASDVPGTVGAELLAGMHDIVDEVFGDAELDGVTYPVYRAEVCVRRLRGDPVPTRFDEVHPRLRLCAERPTDDAISCAMAVARSPSADDDDV